MQHSTRHRAFRVGKLVREGVLQDLILIGGKLWLSQPRKAALHKALANKLAEEWKEAAEASAHFSTINGQLVEELGDVHEACRLARDVLVGVAQPQTILPPHSTGYPGFRETLAKWRQLADSLREADPHAENLSGRQQVLALLETTLLSLHQHLPGLNLSFRQVEEAAAAKRRNKGPLVNIKLEAVSFPADSQWIGTFASKFDELDDPLLLNPAMVTQSW